jgi:DHA2 family multidrug resistance protein
MIWELTSEHPIVDLKVFRHRGFAVGVTIISITFGSYFASVVLIPLWLQTSLGYTATWAGRISALNGTFSILMSAIVPRLMGRVDLRALVSGGVAWIAIIAFWRAHFTSEASFWAIGLPFVAQGIALPFFFVPTTSLTLSSVEPQEVASAAGLSNFLRTSSAAFATSIMTTAWDNTATAKRGELAGRLHDVPGVTDILTAHGLTADQALGQIDRLVQVQATMLATNQLFLYMTFLFFFAAAVAWLAPKSKPGGAAGGGH